MSPALLNVLDLSHRFEGRPPIPFGSFTLNAGSVLLVRGASGCGKSTLLHLLGGVLSIGRDSGTAMLDDINLATISPSTRDRLRPMVVGWMPQRQFMIHSLSVFENLLLPVALRGAVTAEVRQRATGLLQSLAISQLADQRPTTLSVGQAARACLARALLARPKLLLADEPTAALDHASAQLVAQQIRAFAAAGGAVIVASHDPELRSLLSAERSTDDVTSVQELVLP